MCRDTRGLRSANGTYKAQRIQCALDDPCSKRLDAQLRHLLGDRDAARKEGVVGRNHDCHERSTYIRHCAPTRCCARGYPPVLRTTPSRKPCAARAAWAKAAFRAAAFWGSHSSPCDARGARAHDGRRAHPLWIVVAQIRQYLRRVPGHRQPSPQRGTGAHSGRPRSRASCRGGAPGCLARVPRLALRAGRGEDMCVSPVQDVAHSEHMSPPTDRTQRPRRGPWSRSRCGDKLRRLTNAAPARGYRSSRSESPSW